MLANNANGNRRERAGGDPHRERDRWVLITGASSGFGYALARLMDADGWRVFAGVRTDADAARLRAMLSPRSEPLLLDVTDAGHIEAARRVVGERTGNCLDGLVNNAGVVFHGPVECVTVEGLRRQFEVNVVGVFAVTRAFLPFVRAARGRVVVVGSISGRVAWPLNGVYAASKHALRGLVESLRMEQRCFGVRVVLIEPGAFATAIWRKFTPPHFIELEDLEPQVAAQAASAMRMIERAMQRIGKHAPRPDRCVAAIRQALVAKRPRARYTVGDDIWLQLAFARLPAIIKDPLISAAMNRILGGSDRAFQRTRTQPASALNHEAAAEASASVAPAIAP